MIGNPTCQNVLPDLTRGQAKDDCGGFLLRGNKVKPVKSEKYDHRGQGRTLIAIDEWMKCGI